MPFRLRIFLSSLSLFCSGICTQHSWFDYPWVGGLGMALAIWGGAGMGQIVAEKERKWWD